MTSRAGRISASAVVGLGVVGSAFGLFMGNAHAGPPTPQIPGSVAAPTAAEVSPICDAPDPAGVLGPAPSLPANPTSTVVTPSGGVVNFTATSTDLYVDTGSQLITYTLSGTEVSSFALPSGFTGGQRDHPAGGRPVGEHLPGQLLRPAKLDKFSPTGTLLWSVDPEGGNPTGIFSVGTGSAFELVVSVAQNNTGSELVNQSTGAVSGTFPLSTTSTTSPRSRTATCSSRATATSRRSARPAPCSRRSVPPKTRATGSTPARAPSSTIPAQAVQGPDGTIYTADPLDTIEATSPQGYLEGTTTLGQNANGGDILAMGGYNFYLVGSTFYYQGGPPFNERRRQHLVDLAVHPHRLPRRAPRRRPTPSAGEPGSPRRPTGNYFAAGTHPTVVGQLRPVVGDRGLPPPAVLLGGERPPRSTPRPCPPPPPSPCPPRPPAWPTSP